MIPILMFVLFSTFLAVASGTVLTVDVQQTFQEVVGAGAAFSGSTTFLLQQRLNASHRDQLMKFMFGSFDEYQGAQFNAIRVVMGTCDFSLENYTYDDLPKGVDHDFDLSHFSIEKDMQYVIPMIREALVVNPHLRIVASPWTAPAWMKVPQTLFGGVLSNDTNVRRTYAQYFRLYVEAYARHGIPIFAVTVQNEPRFQTTQYPSMQLTPSDEVQMALLIADALQNSTVNNTKVIVYDHNWDDPDYPIEVLSNADVLANDAIIGSAFHCYAGEVAAQGTVHAAVPSKRIFFTECTGGAWAPQFASDLLWDTSNLVIGAVNQWAEFSTKWNMVLDTTGGPHLPAACTNCRGLFAVDEFGNVTVNEDFYPLAHLSMWLNASQRNERVAVSNESIALAIKTPSTVVLVLANAADTEELFHVIVTLNATTKCTFEVALPITSVATVRWSVDGDAADWVVTSGNTSVRRQLQTPAHVQCASSV
jgi:glucosylceramidase